MIDTYAAGHRGSRGLMIACIGDLFSDRETVAAAWAVGSGVHDACMNAEIALYVIGRRRCGPDNATVDAAAQIVRDAETSTGAVDVPLYGFGHSIGAMWWSRILAIKNQVRALAQRLSGVCLYSCLWDGVRRRWAWADRMFPTPSRFLARKWPEPEPIPLPRLTAAVNDKDKTPGTRSEWHKILREHRLAGVGIKPFMGEGGHAVDPKNAERIIEWMTADGA